MKKCPRCEQTKDDSSFSKKTHKSGKIGLRSRCKKCESELYLEWRDRNPKKVQAYWRTNSQRHTHKAKLRKYGLTQEQYDQMIQEQGGVCAICKTKKANAIDHCHTTGVVRGLLCNGCNSALGFMEDNPEILIAGAEYLKATIPIGAGPLS